MIASFARRPQQIAGAVALLLAGAAQADATIYGLIDLSYGKNGYLGTGAKSDFHSGGDDGSSQGNSTTKLGFKGTTEVATGLKANFQLETGGITSDGQVSPNNGAFFNRQAWAGLSGALGEVRLGRQDSVAFQTQVGFDFNGAANAASAYLASGVAAWLPGRQSRSLQYITPTMGGLKLQAGFQPAGNDPLLKTNYSLGGTYTIGPVAIGAVTESKRTVDGKNFSSFAASYDLSVVKVAVTYADGGKVAANGTGKGFGVGATVPVAGFNIGAQFGKNISTSDKAIELFVNKEVFKNTYVYLDAGQLDTNGGTGTIYGLPNGTYKTYAVGMIYAF